MAHTAGWIAIVDDDPSVLRALARLLRSRGINSQTFGSADEFIASLAGPLPECLIVDVQMRGMGGVELQHYLRRNGVTIPSIVITAHGEPELRQRCHEAGAAAFLLKPLQDTALFEAIRQATGRANA